MSHVNGYGTHKSAGQQFMPWGIAAGVAGIAGGGFAIGSHKATRHIPERQASLQQAQQRLQDAVPSYPPSMTEQQAVSEVRKRFGASEALLTAYTQDGDARRVGISQLGDSAYRSAAEASGTGHARSRGLASATLKAGSWHVPAVLNDALAPYERTRTWTEYQQITPDTWTTGPNGQSRHTPGIRIPVERREEYLARYDRFEPTKLGVSSASNGAQQVMDDLGTVEQQAVREADEALRASTRNAPLFKGLAIGAAVVGAGLVGVGALKATDRI